ncbi:MAG: 2Fe-2S iron-sulfur cluster-binding protein [Synechococcus lacustris]|jgi:ferredoxin
MSVRHRVTVHDRQSGLTHSAELEEGDYVLQGFESLGTPLPFSCRNGCCTACAVRVLEGSLDQKEALGLSKDLRNKGYGLLCVARVLGPLEVETQEEDEVYMLQFGNAFARGRVRKALPLDED